MTKLSDERLANIRAGQGGTESINDLFRHIDALTAERDALAAALKHLADELADNPTGLSTLYALNNATYILKSLRAAGRIP